MKIIYCKSISSITVFDSSGVPANDTSIKMDAISETTMIITANVIIFFLFFLSFYIYPPLCSLSHPHYTTATPPSQIKFYARSDNPRLSRG